MTIKLNKKRSYKEEITNEIVEQKRNKVQFHRITNSIGKDPSQPCEECGTVINDFMNKKISDVPSETKENLFICNHCCQYMAGLPAGIKIMDVTKEPKKVEVKKPTNWQLLRKFVDSEGNYYEYGVEKVELKGTQPPTFSIKSNVPKLKLTAKNKLKIQHQAAAILFELKRKNIDSLDDDVKLIYEKYINTIMQIASGKKFPKNYTEIFDRYDTEIKKL